jgi:hypothetical protein
MLAHWRQRAMSPMRMVFLLMMFTFPLLPLFVAPSMGFTTLQDARGLTLIFAVGMIGQDVSSGVLQLLFARPVRRADYVLSRWAAVGIAAAALAIAQLLAAWVILTLRGAAPDPAMVELAMAQRTVEVAQLAAVIALFSALINGIGDLGLWFLAQLAGGALAVVAQWRHWAWLGHVGDEIGHIVAPTINLAGITSGVAGIEPLALALSTTTLALVLAILLVNRKELSYASASG